MTVTVEDIKNLREQTGAGIMDCKRALEEANGDVLVAIEVLQQHGAASVAKKVSRETSEGIVDSYVHGGGRIGAIVEINCETDFVARTPDFKGVAHDIAMQVAAMNPTYLDVSDIPDGEVSTPREVCLLQQPFIKDPTKSIKELVDDAIGRLGENVRVRRFARFSVGE